MRLPRLGRARSLPRPALLALALAAAGCASAPDGAGEPESPAPSPAAQSPAAQSPAAESPAAQTPAASPEPAPADPGVDLPAGITITTAATDFGTVLVDAAGQAIYIWEVETDDVPRCYDGCAAAWPPVLTAGAPGAAGEVSAPLLGTTTRSDGTTQVTYAGHPLYYYAHEAPGEVRCHDVATHGGLWWVVLPDGNRAP